MRSNKFVKGTLHIKKQVIKKICIVLCAFMLLFISACSAKTEESDSVLSKNKESMPQTSDVDTAAPLSEGPEKSLEESNEEEGGPKEEEAAKEGDTDEKIDEEKLPEEETAEEEPPKEETAEEEPPKEETAEGELPEGAIEGELPEEETIEEEFPEEEPIEEEPILVEMTPEGHKRYISEKFHITKKVTFDADNEKTTGVLFIGKGSDNEWLVIDSELFDDLKQIDDSSVVLEKNEEGHWELAVEEPKNNTGLYWLLGIISFVIFGGLFVGAQFLLYRFRNKQS